MVETPDGPGIGARIPAMGPGIGARIPDGPGIGARIPDGPVMGALPGGEKEGLGPELGCC